LALTDLHGINFRNEARLKGAEINSVLELFNSPLWKIKIAFPSINAYYWYLRLRGWEIDNFEFARKSYGNSFALPYSDGTKQELLPILSKLCEKTGSRMRASSYKAKGIHLSISFKGHSHWHEGDTLQRYIFDSRDIYKEATRLLDNCPALGNKVHVIAVSCFSLSKQKVFQPDLFEDIEKKQRLVKAADLINTNWGDFVVTPARMVLTGDMIKDRIAFGQVREL
jgi:DNA polymerase IV